MPLWPDPTAACRSRCQRLFQRPDDRAGGGQQVQPEHSRKGTQMVDRKCRNMSRPPQASGVGLLARRGRVVAVAGALAVTPMITGFPHVASWAPAHPVTSHVRQVGFVRTSVAAMRTGGNATRSALNPDMPEAPDPITTARTTALTPVQDMAGTVAVVGVTWPKGAASAKDQYMLTGANWTPWASLGLIDGGPEASAAASATTGTDPYVVTGASKYGVRSLTTQATAAVAATVQAIDPGTSAADSVQQAPGGASAANAKPTIYTRAQWGANESLMSWPRPTARSWSGSSTTPSVPTTTPPATCPR